MNPLKDCLLLKECLLQMCLSKTRKLNIPVKVMSIELTRFKKKLLEALGLILMHAFLELELRKLI